MTAEDMRMEWLNFIKALTRALVQINLYNAAHPQVAEAVKLAENSLDKIFAVSPKLTLVLDADKLIINKIPVLSSDKLPNSIRNIFKKFNIQSVSFNKGVSEEEIKKFCAIHVSKVPLEQFLKESDFTNITVNKDIYEKIDKTPPKKPVPQIHEKNLFDRIRNEKLESSIAAIAANITQNPAERKTIVETILAKVNAKLQEEINKAVIKHKKEKKKAENDSVRAESVISNMGEGVVVVNNEGQILSMNENAQNISGKSLKEVAGKKIFDVASLENQLLTLAEEIKPESDRDIKKDVLEKGNKELSQAVKKSTAIIKNEDGKIVGTVSIPTDKAKLMEAQKLKDDFVANITHELRSPLTSIKASLELLSRESAISEKSKNILNMAVRNSERLHNLINDILDFSKLESGKLTVRLSDENPAEIVNEAYESMKAWAQSKQMDFSQSCQSDLPKIYADKNRTVQILINLVSNSIKFAPEKGKVEISAERGEKEFKNFILFSVKDTGPGIKKEERDKIFGKFVQLASGEKASGTGLGLSLVKALIMMQDGRIDLKSEYGKGATFTVAMPLYRKAEIQEPAPSKKSWWKRIFG